MTSFCNHSASLSAMQRKATIQISAVILGVLIASGFMMAVMAGLASLQMAVEPLPAMQGSGTPPGPFTAIGFLACYGGSGWLGIRVARLLVTPVYNKLRFW